MFVWSALLFCLVNPKDISEIFKCRKNQRRIHFCHKKKQKECLKPHFLNWDPLESTKSFLFSHYVFECFQRMRMVQGNFFFILVSHHFHSGFVSPILAHSLPLFLVIYFVQIFFDFFSIRSKFVMYLDCWIETETVIQLWSPNPSVFVWVYAVFLGNFFYKWKPLPSSCVF